MHGSVLPENSCFDGNLCSPELFTALHSHMLDDEPRPFFMHFWANDDAVKLAKGLRAALDKTHSKKGK